MRDQQNLLIFCLTVAIDQEVGVEPFRDTTRFRTSRIDQCRRCVRNHSPYRRRSHRSSWYAKSTISSGILFQRRKAALVCSRLVKVCGYRQDNDDKRVDGSSWRGSRAGRYAADSRGKSERSFRGRGNKSARRFYESTFAIGEADRQAERKVRAQSTSATKRHGVHAKQGLIAGALTCARGLLAT